MGAVSVLESLASRPLVRRLTDVIMGRFAAFRTAQLDHCSPLPIQQRTLLRLVRRARRTRFGVDHDFGGIRSIADYQRRVPLRSYESFWTDYWRGPFPHLAGVTWPGPIPYFALSSGTTSGATKYIPLTREMLASNQKAALTTLSLFLSRHPGTPLFTGRLFFLGGSTDLRDLSAGDARPLPNGRGSESVPEVGISGGRGSCRAGFPLDNGSAGASPSRLWDSLSDPILAGDLSGITVREASPLLRPFTFPPEKLALVSDWDEKMDLLAESSVPLPITMLSGVPSWLLVLFDRLRRLTGRECIADIWPGLRLVIHGGTRFDPYRAVFRTILGSADVHCLETYPASEGFIATEDPRHDLLRLIPDHNLFFEFVPVEDLGSTHPARHTVADLEIGVQYAIVLTTCAGLWSYVVGDTVCFERRHPPLLRFTGRTRYFLSVFGEHVISEEAEMSIAAAANAIGTWVVDFHVGPFLPVTPGQPGRHRWFVEFADTICPQRLARFAQVLDAELGRRNEDYAAHRAGDLAMREPAVVPVPRGGFADWMRCRGRLGGQNKVPRMDNSGQITDQLARFFARS